MNDVTVTRIREIARQFREAIDRVPNWPDDTHSMQSFPLDCCHHATKLLGAYLHELGFQDLKTIVGTLPDGHQHLWLEAGDITVDITADQFGQDKVMVARHSKWHYDLGGKVNRLESTESFWASVPKRPYHAAIYPLIQLQIERTFR